MVGVSLLQKLRRVACYSLVLLLAFSLAGALPLQIVKAVSPPALTGSSSFSGTVGSPIDITDLRVAGPSCGVSCVMSLEHQDLPHDTKTERSLWRQSGAPYNFPGGIGLILRSLGYDVHYTVNRDHHFVEGKYPIQDIETNSYTSETADEYVRLHDAAVAAGMAVTIGEVEFDDLVDALRDGQLPILGIHMPFAPHILHWLLVHGYNKLGSKHTLDVADPMGQIHSLNERCFARLVDSYMGRRVIYVGKNKGTRP